MKSYPTTGQAPEIEHLVGQRGPVEEIRQVHQETGQVVVILRSHCNICSHDEPFGVFVDRTGEGFPAVPGYLDARAAMSAWARAHAAQYGWSDDV